MRTPLPHPPRDARGVTLVELMIALVILAVGVMAIAQLFPAGARGQARDRLYSQGSLYAQQKLEELSTASWVDSRLTVGRHPASGFDTLGTHRNFKMSYQVSAMTAPLDNLRNVTVSVIWNQTRPETASATTYLRQ